MAKFSDINKAAELKEAYDKYKLWQAKTRVQKDAAFDLVNKADDKRVGVGKIRGYVLPFSTDGIVNHYPCQVIPNAPTGVGNETALIVKNLINDRFKLELAATDILIPVKKFRYAKLMASERVETATTKSKSRFTDTPYKRHQSNNLSCSFGRTAENESYHAAIKDIAKKTAFGTFAATKGNRIGFVAERG